MFLVCYIFLLLTVMVANAAVRNVGPGQTHTTLQGCLNVAVAGDECRMFTATYDALTNTVNSGTALNPIVITAASGNTATLTATSGGCTSEGAIEVNHSYITIDGTLNGGNITFDGGTGLLTPLAAVFIEPPNSANVVGVKVRNVTFQNWMLNAACNASDLAGNVTTQPSSDFTQFVEDVEITGNRFSNTRGVAIFLLASYDGLIENNEAFDLRCYKRSNNSAQVQFIKVAGGAQANPNKGDNNTVRNNTMRDFSNQATCASELTGETTMNIAPWYCDAGPSDNLVERNLIFNIGQGDSNNVYRMLHDESSCPRSIIQNNIVYNVGGALVQSRNSDNSTYQHNSFYRGTQTGNIPDVQCFRFLEGNANIFRSNICEYASGATDATGIQINELAFEEPGAHTINYNAYVNVDRWMRDIVNNGSPAQPPDSAYDIDTTLAAWQSATPYDDNSSTAASGYNSPTTGDMTLVAGSAHIANAHDGKDKGAWGNAPSIASCDIGNEGILSINWNPGDWGGITAISNSLLDIEYDGVNATENSSVVQTTTQTRTTMSAAPTAGQVVRAKLSHGAVTTTQGIGAVTAFADAMVRNKNREDATGTVCTNNVSSGTPTFVSCLVPDSGTDNHVIFTFNNAGSPPMLPASGATGLSCRRDAAAWAVSGTCTRVAADSNQFDCTMTTAGAAGEVIDCSYVQASGNITNTALTELAAFTNSGCTNDIADPPAAPEVLNCSVEDQTRSTVTCTFNSAGFPPMLPASGCAGMSFKRNAVAWGITSCTRILDDQMQWIMETDAQAGETLTRSYAGASGNITNSQPTELADFTDQAVTNNIVAGAHTLTLRSYRVHEITALSASVPQGEWLGSLNRPSEVIPQGRALVVFQWQVTGAGEPASAGRKLRCSQDGGAYFDVQNDFNGNLIAFSSADTQITDGGALASSLLGSPGSGTFLAGTLHRTANSIGVRQLTVDQYTESGYGVRVAGTAVAGVTTFSCQPTLTDNTPMGCSAPACPAVLNVIAGKAFGF